MRAELRPMPEKAIACVLAILIVLLSGCSRVYHFSGVIVDGDGQPVTGATIMLYPLKWERPPQPRNDGMSDDDGHFVAHWCCAVGVEYFQMVVSKAGYREHDRLVQADETDLRIVLERSPDEDHVSVKTDSTRSLHVDEAFLDAHPNSLNRGHGTRS